MAECIQQTKADLLELDLNDAGEVIRTTNTTTHPAGATSPPEDPVLARLFPGSIAADEVSHPAAAFGGRRPRPPFRFSWLPRSKFARRFAAARPGELGRHA